MGKGRPLAVEKIDEEKKVGGPAPAGGMLEKKKLDLSVKFDKGVAKKASVPREKLRVLSGGQPRVSSSGSFEIPLTLEVETSEKTFSLNINLSIKLDQIEPKGD